MFVIPRPGHVRIVAPDPGDPHTEVTPDLLSAAVEQALGRPVALHSPRWLTRFGDAARQATDYVRGNVVLAGDAAHIHPPAGSAGINVALDDAVNLGWKLAATVRGTAPPVLLTSYHTERHAAGARVLANTRAQALLGDLPQPVTDLLTRVASHPAGTLALAEILTGLDTRYDLGGDDPQLGRFVPGLTLPSGRGALLNHAPDSRVDSLSSDGPPMLVRPDGHVAWVSSGGDDEGLSEALDRWFGRPPTSESTPPAEPVRQSA